MKTFLTLLACSLLILASKNLSAQNELPTGQIRAELVGSGVMGPDFFVLGGGIGASARMWKYFSVNGGLSYGQRDFPLSGGTIERRVTHLTLSTDFYPAKTYRGFYIGPFLSYMQVGKEAKNGLNPILLVAEPDAYVALGLQLGFNASISPSLHLFSRASLGLSFDNLDGLYTGCLGIGYTFLPVSEVIFD